MSNSAARHADENASVAPLSGRDPVHERLVPDRAMVPSASTISSRLMPTPLSSTVRRRFSASIRSVRQGFGPPDRLEAEPLAGIGGVGDQLAQENVPIRVDLRGAARRRRARGWSAPARHRWRRARPRRRHRRRRPPRPFPRSAHEFTAIPAPEAPSPFSVPLRRGRPGSSPSSAQPGRCPMGHGSPPRLMAPQSIRSADLRESSPTPSPETVSGVISTLSSHVPHVRC